MAHLATVSTLQQPAGYALQARGHWCDPSCAHQVRAPRCRPLSAGTGSRRELAMEWTARAASRSTDEKSRRAADLELALLQVQPPPCLHSWYRLTHTRTTANQHVAG